MPTINLIPQSHHVFNEFDSQGILLGLSRLEAEKNPEYKQRLFDVFVHRASSSYLGLIYGITRELGLKIQKSLTISPVKDINDVPIVVNPGVMFQHTKCILYEDFCSNDVLLEIDPRETKRTTALTNAIYTNVFNYVIPADLKSDSVIDIRPQTPRANQDNLSLSSTKDFDRFHFGFTI